MIKIVYITTVLGRKRSDILYVGNMVSIGGIAGGRGGKSSTLGSRPTKGTKLGGKLHILNDKFGFLGSNY
jgi:hypothetical protein